jgi:tetratricopeptide (TPR) repeat protein
MSEGITKEELIEQFKGNKILKISTAVVGAVVLVVVLFLGYKSLIAGPKNQESRAMVANGINWMEKDSLDLAVEEFEFVAAEYSGYDGGNIANYSLGNIYYEQGKFEEALAALEKVDLDDTYLMTLAIGTQGDCYSELGDYEQAVSMYVKAAKRIENQETTPNFYFKAGLNAEEATDFAKAKEFYTIIKEEYPTFASQKAIDKYITRVDRSTK